VTNQTAAVTALVMQQRFCGKVLSVPDHYGFIGEVTEIDGEPRQTNGDVYIHQEDCDTKLTAGLMLEFEMVPDPKRQGNFRAKNAKHIPAPIALPDNVKQLPMLVRRQMYHHTAKEVPAGEVRKAVANKPFAAVVGEVTDTLVDLETPAEVHQLLLKFLYEAYPGLMSVGINFDYQSAGSAEERAMVEESIKMQNELGMGSQAAVLMVEYEMYVSACSILREFLQDGFLTPPTQCSTKMLGAMMGDVSRDTLRKEGSGIEDVGAFASSFVASVNFMRQNQLMRPGCILPMSNIVDLFVAAPVWYIEAKENLPETWNSTDPEPDVAVQYFASRIKTQRWADLYQMFNRRTRRLARYRGDIIPPHILRTLAEARKHFDFVVIATPYHDVAGREWQDPNWHRLIDPYLVGFKKGLPYMFYLGRWSDKGIFPLMADMVADTMAYIRSNLDNLQNFGHEPFWHLNDTHLRNRDCDSDCYDARSYLPKLARDMLVAFEAGILFSWIRDEAKLQAESQIQVG
jgi:hypothetical protein